MFMFVPGSLPACRVPVAAFALLCALCLRNLLVSSCNNPPLLPPRVRTHSTATYTRAVWMEAWRWRPLTTLRLLHVDTARENVTNARQCTPVAFRCLVPRLPETAWVRQARPPNDARQWGVGPHG